MGSRKQTNFGGSGKECSRIEWAVKNKPKQPLQFEVPFKKLDDLELYLSGDVVMCLECGLDFKSLGTHLSRAHAMSSSLYKEKYNIPKTRSLTGKDLQEKKRSLQKKLWLSGKLENVREYLIKNCDNLIKQATSAPRKSTIHQDHFNATCPTCNQEFTKRREKYVFCSKKCHTASPKEQERLLIIAAAGGKTRASGKRDVNGKFSKDEEIK